MTHPHRVTVEEELRTSDEMTNLRTAITASTQAVVGATGPTGPTGPRGVTGSTGVLPGPVTVTGSRGANAALASLLTGLASLGIVTDSSS